MTRSSRVECQTGHMPITVRSGPWDRSKVEHFLASSVIPVRLASSGRHGPIVQSLWFAFDDDSLWCATQSASVLASRLRRDPAVGWEVSADHPPYRGVRGTGRALLVDDAAQTLQLLIDRYGQAQTRLAHWLLARVHDEVAIRITDLSVTSWDFSARMSPGPDIGSAS